MQIMIHSCHYRLWYVKEYLVKSLYDQGFKEDEVIIYSDDEYKGNLQACMDSFASLPEDGNTWHLQDDVIISRDFRDKVIQYDDFDGIVCGFMSEYDVDNEYAHNHIDYDLLNLGWSFPCIKIPNKVARLCAEMYNIVNNDRTIEMWKEQHKGDDAIFRLYLERYNPKIPHINLVPNIVDHIDYLLGGSMVNRQRQKPVVRALYFDDLDLVDELERELDGRI